MVITIGHKPKLYVHYDPLKSLFFAASKMAGAGAFSKFQAWNFIDMCRGKSNLRFAIESISGKQKIVRIIKPESDGSISTKITKRELNKYNSDKIVKSQISEIAEVDSWIADS